MAPIKGPEIILDIFSELVKQRCFDANHTIKHPKPFGATQVLELMIAFVATAILSRLCLAAISKILRTFSGPEEESEMLNMDRTTRTRKAIQALAEERPKSFFTCAACSMMFLFISDPLCRLPPTPFESRLLIAIIFTLGFIIGFGWMVLWALMMKGATNALIKAVRDASTDVVQRYAAMEREYEMETNVVYLDEKAILGVNEKACEAAKHIYFC